jgi:hypothetical protein
MDKKMNAEQFYTDYVNKLSVIIKYKDKSKKGLLFEVMEEYSKYRNK